jgi:hypothetical protein
MTEPQRLLAAGSDASSFERSLLHAGRARREPLGMRERVVTAVAAGAAATSVAANAKAATAVKGAGIAGAVTKGKILLATAVVASAGATGYVASTSSEPPVASRLTPVMTAIPRAAVTAAKPTTAVSPAELPTVPHPRRHASPAKPPAAPIDDRLPTTSEASALAEEASLVEQSRAALAGGDVGGARAKLAEADARYPRGQLGEERDALRVRLAAASGDPRRAAVLARAFLERHPGSVLRPSIEPFAKKVEIE